VDHDRTALRVEPAGALSDRQRKAAAENGGDESHGSELTGPHPVTVATVPTRPLGTCPRFHGKCPCRPCPSAARARTSSGRARCPESPILPSAQRAPAQSPAQVHCRKR